MAFIIAIDGPAGTGKSSLAKELSKSLGFIYVDTGAIYRALAYLCVNNNVDPHSEDDLVPLIKKIEIYIDESSLCSRIRVKNHILDSELRSEEMSKLASVVGSHKKVRLGLLDLQRSLAHLDCQGLVFEGRDIGTVIFPQADLKIFITAKAETRAQRRYEEMKNRGYDVDYNDILEAIKHRDERDQTRLTAPTQKAADAILIDSSDLSLEEVLKKSRELVELKQKKLV